MTAQLNFHKNRGFGVVLTTAVALAMTAAAVPAFADAPLKPIGGASLWASQHSKQMKTLQKSAGKLLIDRLQQTNDLIKKGDYTGSQMKLAAAQDTAGAIVAMDPAIAVSAQLADAARNLPLENMDRFRAELTPIYARLDDLSNVKPALAQKAGSELQHAEAIAGKGDITTAQQQIKAIEDEVRAGAVYFPIQTVYRQIDKASKNIASTNTITASMTAKARDDIAKAQNWMSAYVKTSGTNGKA
jgi:hypothetical protein